MMDKKIIGKGRTAEVYEWNENQVVKLFYKSIRDDFIQYEKRIGLLVYKAGISSPAVYQIIETNDRKGIIYERIKGQTLLEKVMKKPWRLRYYAYKMAESHAMMHAFSINDLPNGKEELCKRMDDRKDIIKGLSDGVSLCHGDFHPDNIMVTKMGLKTLDWTNAYSGHPASDVARTYLLIHTPYMDENTPKWIHLFFKGLKKCFYYFYFKRYQKLTGINKHDVKQWLIPVSYARLKENILGEREWLLDIIKEGSNKKNRKY